MKAARYKIFIGNNKVFDHVSMGNRGNIDKKEYRALNSRVKGLDASSPAVSLHGTVPRALHSPAPSLDAVRAGQRRGHSHSHPQFTDLQHTSVQQPAKVRLQGQMAMNYATLRTA
jgi:hypothetical protein